MAPAKLVGYTVNTVGEAVHATTETHAQKETRWRQEHLSKRNKKKHLENMADEAEAKRVANREAHTQTSIGKILTATSEAISEVMNTDEYHEDEELELFESNADKRSRKEKRMEREGFDCNKSGKTDLNNCMVRTAKKMEEEMLDQLLWEDEECAPGFTMITVSSSTFAH